jgi:peptidoglycan/LPS O-acetylase OafA/YrhL
MYLYHVGVGYFLLTRLPPHAGLWLGSRPPIYAIVQLAPVVIVSYLAYRAVELPSLRYLERFSSRSRKPREAAPSPLPHVEQLASGQAVVVVPSTGASDD